MKKIVVATHGHLANGVKSLLEILGANTEQVEWINAYIDGESIETSIETIFQELNENDELIVFTDLYGGSVNQKFVKYANLENVFLIAGFNIPVILEILYLTEPLTANRIEAVIESCRLGLKLVVPDRIKNQNGTQTELNFFE